MKAVAAIAAAVMLCFPLQAAAEPLSDAALANLLTGRNFDAVDKEWRSGKAVQSPMRMTIFCAAEI